MAILQIFFALKTRGNKIGIFFNKNFNNQACSFIKIIINGIPNISIQI